MQIKDYISNDENSLELTLKLMKQFEAEAVNDKSFRQFVLKTFKPGANLFKSIWEYMRNNFAYKEDIPDELIIYPMRLLELKYGDCDDFALFTKSILDVLNYNSDFILLSKNQKDFTHIAVMTKGNIIDATNSMFNKMPVGYNNLRFV